jgi:hypothetical protein
LDGLFLAVLLKVPPQLEVELRRLIVLLGLYLMLTHVDLRHDGVIVVLSDQLGLHLVDLGHLVKDSQELSGPDTLFQNSLVQLAVTLIHADLIQLASPRHDVEDVHAVRKDGLLTLNSFFASRSQEGISPLQRGR